MIVGYFGVPRVGKTTTLTKIAQKELKRIKRGKSSYEAVYTNFYCKGCFKIKYSDLAYYKVRNSLLLFDELTLDADNRRFKEFSDEHRDFFILHGHLCDDIIYATQNYDKVDSKIRDLTQELWYMSKSVVPILRNFTSAKRIYRKININENTSELTMGYRFCNFLEALFVSNYKLTFRPFYYNSFNSFDEMQLGKRKELPKEYWPCENLKRSKILELLNKLESKIRPIPPSSPKLDTLSDRSVSDKKNEGFDYVGIPEVIGSLSRNAEGK